MWQQILDVQYATNIIRVILIYRNTTIIIIYNAFQYIRQGAFDIKVDDILTTGHDLFAVSSPKRMMPCSMLLLFFDIIPYLSVPELVPDRRRSAHDFFWTTFSAQIPLQ
jgi:hypothetical protein